MCHTFSHRWQNVSALGKRIDLFSGGKEQHSEHVHVILDCLLLPGFISIIEHWKYSKQKDAYTMINTHESWPLLVISHMENTNTIQYSLYSEEDLVTNPAIYSRVPEEELPLEKKILKRRSKRYKDSVLWVWHEMFSTPKRYQFQSNKLSHHIFPAENPI